ncbi:MAG: hypothetical protein WKF73_09975 [Nocardioidaceae bacterium]
MPGEDEPDLEEVRAMRSKTLSKRTKLLKAFRAELDAAVAGLSVDEASELVLHIFDEDLAARLDSRVAAERGELTATFRRWADKYVLSLAALEGERDAAVAHLGSHLSGLGYA